MGVINGNFESTPHAVGSILLGDNEFESGALTVAANGSVTEGALLQREADGKFSAVSAVKTTTYEEVVPPTGSSPKFEGWYEKDGTVYELSTDTSVGVGKTYYKQVVTVQEPVAVYVGDTLNNATGSAVDFEIRAAISGRVDASKCHYGANSLSAADKDLLRAHSIIALDVVK